MILVILIVRVYTRRIQKGGQFFIFKYLNIYKAIAAVIFFQYKFVRRWAGVATKIVSNASCEMNGAIRFAKEPSAAETHGELYLWTCNND